MKLLGKCCDWRSSHRRCNRVLNGNLFGRDPPTNLVYFYNVQKITMKKDALKEGVHIVVSGIVPSKKNERVRSRHGHWYNTKQKEMEK